MANDTVSLPRAELLELAREIGAEIRRGGETPEQRLRREHQELFARNQAARAALVPLVPLPAIDSGELALAVLDQVVTLHVRGGFSHVEKRTSGDHVHEITYVDANAPVKLTVREALSGIARHDGTLSANPCRWVEAESLGALVRALKARFDHHAAEFNRGNRELAPLALGAAVELPFHRIDRAGPAGKTERVTVPVVEHPAAW